MRSFTDSKSFTWNVDLNYAAAKRIDSADASAVYSKPFAFLGSGELNETFFQDVLLSRGLSMFMVWCIVKPQADQQQISEDDFAERLDANAMSQAKEALWDEIADFFPEKGTILSRLRTLYGNLHSEAGKILAGEEAGIVESITNGIKKMLGELRGKAGVT